ncbi:MAG: hypothetical protein K8T89_10035 [Planctomycetes bacterium]|nr:hypothetical protein [Planctomycetota bacterium]
MARLLWSIPFESLPRGMCLAREVDRLLVWTDANRILIANRQGEKDLRYQFAKPITVAAISDDGSGIVVAAADGQVSWLEPDRKIRWDRQVKGKPTAVAVDSLGTIAAIATEQGQLAFFYSDGEAAREATCPRPARHLAFTPATGALLAMSDMGWLASFNLEAGGWSWRDAPVLTLGSLAVAGSGDPILIACFSGGLRGYKHDGEPYKMSSRFGAIRLAAVDYHANLILTVGLDGIIEGSNKKGVLRFSFKPDLPVSLMALSGLGDRLYLCLGDRSVSAFELPSKTDLDNRGDSFLG